MYNSWETKPSFNEEAEDFEITVAYEGPELDKTERYQSVANAMDLLIQCRIGNSWEVANSRVQICQSGYCVNQDWEDCDAAWKANNYNSFKFLEWFCGIPK